eukprot:GHVR01109792.1.p1 GENE.GHVR01109792.1~~GHVR01109792.1.p1  ORF type:complete len:262 (+),score=53.67 GHVR01109792.1:125-910(+)
MASHVIERDVVFVDFDPGRYSCHMTNGKVDKKEKLPFMIDSRDELFEDCKLPPQEWQEFSSNIRTVPAGLLNRGVSCYLNSVIQVLIYNPALSTYLLSEQHTNNCIRHKDGISCSLCDLQRHTHSSFYSNKKIMRNDVLLSSLRRVWRFDRCEMQDAHETFMKLLHGLNLSCVPPSVQSVFDKLPSHVQASTLINKLFTGFQRSTVCCLTCSAASHKYELCSDISIEIGDVSSVNRGLEKFTKKELLMGNNQYQSDTHTLT